MKNIDYINKNLIVILVTLILLIILILLYRLYMLHDSKLLESFESFESSNEPNKIAFLFLTYNNLKRPDIWNKFFDIEKNNNDSNNDSNTFASSKYSNKFTIYNHAKEPENVTDILLKDKQIPEHIETCWGCFGTVEANILMMKEALKEPLNTKFILVSDSCIPIVSFDKFYNEIMKDDKSRINIFYNQPQRYYDIINPPFSKDKFIKNAAQGLIFNRYHAELLVNSLLQYKNDWQNMGCVDEHYFGNILRILDTNFELNNENIKNTFDVWNVNELNTKQNNENEITFNDNQYALINYISNKTIDELRYKKFLLARKVDDNTGTDIEYITK